MNAHDHATRFALVMLSQILYLASVSTCRSMKIKHPVAAGAMLTLFYMLVAFVMSMEMV